MTLVRQGWGFILGEGTNPDVLEKTAHRMQDKWVLIEIL